jgi:subtilisin family serine protease
MLCARSACQFLLVCALVCVAAADTCGDVGSVFEPWGGGGTVPEAADAGATLHGGGVQLGAPWHLDRLDQRGPALDGAFLAAARGAGAHVYVLAAGVNAAHDEFLDEGGAGSRVCAAYTFDGAQAAGIDARGEGTLAAGLAAGRVSGVAKAAAVHSVKVVADGGPYEASEAAVLAGARWIAVRASGLATGQGGNVLT